MKSPSLVIFDLDGTIVDSGKTVLKLLNNIRSQLGMPTMEFSQISNVLSLGGRGLIEAALGSKVDSKTYLHKFRDMYLSDSLEGEQLYSGALEYLQLLMNRGIKMAICTNKPSQLVEKVLSHHKIELYFNYVVADNGGLPKKPNPDGLLQILKWTNLNANQAILVGDSRIDQLAASSAGIGFAFHRAGYDDGVCVDNANICFNTFHELLRRYP